MPVAYTDRLVLEDGADADLPSFAPVRSTKGLCAVCSPDPARGASVRVQRDPLEVDKPDQVGEQPDVDDDVRLRFLDRKAVPRRRPASA